MILGDDIGEELPKKDSEELKLLEEGLQILKTVNDLLNRPSQGNQMTVGEMFLKAEKG